ncbi:DUF4406 domain-containing protein [Vibrio algicola]|uniref:DUF4406 domain-containing protein n=1 Tax=Vibrio algicola TaxID=2662262 RepID=A0A5Q0TF20_9VIBR|nr:DUF4406 domain-containing protein [Vibrio algicola]
MKLYLAGPMSGYENDNKFEFYVTALELRAQYRDHIIINPAVLPSGLEQHEYMDICCAMVRACEGIVLLEGWECSLGATAEYYLAKKLGKKVFSVEGDILIALEP